MKKKNRILRKALGIITAGSLVFGGALAQAETAAAAEQPAKIVDLNACCTEAKLEDSQAGPASQDQGKTVTWTVDPTREYKVTLSFAETGNIWQGQEMVYRFPAGFRPSSEGAAWGGAGASAKIKTGENGQDAIDARYEIGADGKLHVYPKRDDPDYEKMAANSNDNISVEIEGFFTTEGTSENADLVAPTVGHNRIAFEHPMKIYSTDVKGKGLTGSSFVITEIKDDKEEEVPRVLESLGDGEYSVSLPAGDYSLKTKAPDNYQAAPVYFRMGEDGVLRYKSQKNGNYDPAEDNVLEIVNLIPGEDDPVVEAGLQEKVPVFVHAVFDDDNDADHLRPRDGGIHITLMKDGMAVKDADGKTVERSIREKDNWEADLGKTPLKEAAGYSLKVDPVKDKNGERTYTVTVNKYADDDRVFFNIVAVRVPKNRNGGSSAATGSARRTGSAVKTGDTSHPFLDLIVFLAAAAVCVLLFRIRNDRRRQKQLMGIGLSLLMAASAVTAGTAGKVCAETKNADLPADGWKDPGTGNGAAGGTGSSSEIGANQGSGGNTAVPAVNSNSSDRLEESRDSSAVSISEIEENNGHPLVSPAGKAGDGSNTKKQKKQKTGVTKLGGDDFVLVGDGTTASPLNAYFAAAELTDEEGTSIGRADDGTWKNVSVRRPCRLTLTWKANDGHTFASVGEQTQEGDHTEFTYELPESFRFADSAAVGNAQNVSISGDGYTLKNTKFWGETVCDENVVRPVMHLKFDKNETNLEKFKADNKAVIRVSVPVYVSAGEAAFAGNNSSQVVKIETKPQKTVKIRAEKAENAALEGVVFELTDEKGKPVEGVPSWMSRSGKEAYHTLHLEEGTYLLNVVSLPENATKPGKTWITFDNDLPVSGEAVKDNWQWIGKEHEELQIGVRIDSSPNSVKMSVICKNARGEVLTPGELVLIPREGATEKLEKKNGMDYYPISVSRGFSGIIHEEEGPANYIKTGDRYFHIDTAGHLFLNSGEVKPSGDASDPGYLLELIHLEDKPYTRNIHVWAQTSWNDMENLDNVRPKDRKILLTSSKEKNPLKSGVAVPDAEAVYDFGRWVYELDGKGGAKYSYTVGPENGPGNDYSIGMVDVYPQNPKDVSERGMQITTIIYRHVPKKTPTPTKKPTPTPAGTTPTVAPAAATGTPESTQAAVTPSGAVSTPEVSGAAKPAPTTAP